MISLRCCFAVAVAVTGMLWSSSGTQARDPAGMRMALFQRASARSGVPVSVLIGLAWEQSFLSDHEGQTSIDGGHGLMDLSSRPQHDTLEAAARLVHVPARRLLRDDALNVLGGALLLAQEARNEGHGRLPRAIGDWAEASVRFTGMRTMFAARLLVNDMYGALRKGIRAPGIELAPIEVARPNLAALDGLGLLTDRAGEISGPADYPDAVWEPAEYNNFTDERRPASHRIRYIVIHDTESSCASAASWFQTPGANASAHYLVCNDGRVIQLVHERDIAWHAGNWPINQESIGIEHEGYRDHNYYTRAQYLASAALVSYLCDKYGIDPDRNVIFGHENVPAADHTDPGPFWNWQFYMSRVRDNGTAYDTGMTRAIMITGNATIYSCPETSCTVLGTANWGEEFYRAGSKFQVSSSRFRAPSSKFKVQSSKYRVPSSEFQVERSKFQVPSAKCRGGAVAGQDQAGSRSGRATCASNKWDAQSGWTSIYYGGQVGWVESTVTDSGSGFEVGISTTTSVRAAAQPKATVLGTVSAGQAYISLTRDNGYWYIYYNHRYGFIPISATLILNCVDADPADQSSITPDCTLELGLWARSLGPGVRTGEV